MRPAAPATPRRERWIAWVVRTVSVISAALLLGTCYARCGERPAFLSLRTDADGPPIARARKVLIFLHGYGGSISSMDWLRDELRQAKLSEEVAVILVDGPYASGLGRSWGDNPSQEATSVGRVRALLGSEIPDGVPASHIVIAGFSQGAGIAANVAAQEPRVGTLVSLSGCRFPAKDELAARRGLVSFVAHGSADSLCSVGQSRALVASLEAAGSSVRYVEFAGNHVIPPEVVSALVEVLNR